MVYLNQATARSLAALMQVCTLQQPGAILKR